MKKRPVRLALLVFSAAALIILSSCGSDGLFNSDGRVDNTNSVVEENFSIAVVLTNQTRFRLEGINGNVQITGSTDSTSISVSGVKQVGSESLTDAAAHLPELEVQVSNMRDEILVKTVQPKETGGRNYVVNYDITIPGSLALVADNINGNMWVSGFENGARVGNVNGNIQLNAITGNCDVSLVNGNIDGEVIMPEGGSIDMTTVNGNVSLRIPKNTSGEFSANLVNGSIAMSNLQLENPVSSRTSLRGRLGDGNGTISLRTTNGNISATGF